MSARLIWERTRIVRTVEDAHGFDLAKRAAAAEKAWLAQRTKQDNLKRDRRMDRRPTRGARHASL